MSLRHVILTVLQRGPATGYGIVKDFDEALGFFWSASHQQVYRDLAQLTADGLVRFTAVDQDHKPDKKVYELTAAGRRELRAWVAAPMKPQRSHDEFLVKLLAGGLLGSPSLPAMVARERAQHQAALETYRAIERENFSAVPPEALPPLERMLYLALRKGILGQESWLAWADELDEAIRALGPRAEGD